MYFSSLLQSGFIVALLVMVPSSWLKGRQQKKKPSAFNGRLKEHLVLGAITGGLLTCAFSSRMFVRVFNCAEGSEVPSN